MTSRVRTSWAHFILMRTKNRSDEEQRQGPIASGSTRRLFTVPIGVKMHAILGNSALPGLEVAWEEVMP